MSKLVLWTADGEAKGAHSEHGTHKRGDVVETEHADVLIKRGFAELAPAGAVAHVAIPPPPKPPGPPTEEERAARIARDKADAESRMLLYDLMPSDVRDAAKESGTSAIDAFVQHDIDTRIVEHLNATDPEEPDADTDPDVAIYESEFPDAPERQKRRYRKRKHESGDAE